MNSTCGAKQVLYAFAFADHSSFVSEPFEMEMSPPPFLPFWYSPSKGFIFTRVFLATYLRWQSFPTSDHVFVDAIMHIWGHVCGVLNFFRCSMFFSLFWRDVECSRPPLFCFRDSCYCRRFFRVSVAPLVIFVTQEQRKRWRAKRKLVSGSKHWERFCGVISGISFTEKFRDCIFLKSCNLVYFWPQNGSQCRPKCVLKHVNNGTRDPLRNDP